MSSVVDEFDGKTNDRLFWLKKDIEAGYRSDWISPQYKHGLSMTCGTAAVLRKLLPNWKQSKWYDQLADLLVDKRVESLLPGDRADSIGDRWAKHRTWTWTTDERIELL